MEKAEIKAIADYLKDLEEGLVEWDYRGISPYLQPYTTPGRTHRRTNAVDTQSGTILTVSACSDAVFCP